MWTQRQLILCLITLFILSCSPSGTSKDIEVKSIPHLDVKHTKLYDLTATSAQLIASPTALAPYHKELMSWLTLQQLDSEFSLFGGTHWYAITLTNQTKQNRWVLNVKDSIVEYIEYYIYDENQRTDIISGYHAADEFLLTYGRSVDFAVDQTVTLLVKVSSPVYGSVPSITLSPFDSYNSQYFIRLMVILLCLGATLTLFVYNGFLYLGTRQTELLYYSGYLLCLFTTWCLIFQIPAELFQLEYLQLYYISFGLLPYLGGRFCIQFLDLKVTMPITAKLIMYTGNASAITGIVTLFFIAYGHATLSLFVATWMALSLFAGVIRWRQKFKPASYFTIAFLCLLLPASLILPANMGILSDVLQHSELAGLIGGTLDGVLLAFAIAYRMRLLAEDNTQLNTDLENKVASRTKELQLLNQQLTVANESKRQFLANIGHELRTPMTSIIGFSDLLKSGVCTEKERNEYSNVISSSSYHLLSIVNDLLDMSKIEAQKLHYSFAAVDIIKLIRQLIIENTKTAREKGIAFNCRIAYPFPNIIETDPVRLKQVLLNLVSNSLKFTEHGHVTVSVGITNNNIYFSVEDTGIGISNKQAENLFQAFEQGDNSISRRYGGTGLGLHLSKQLAEGLNGNLSFETELALGSTFTLEIPCQLCQETQWIKSVEDEQADESELVTPSEDNSYRVKNILDLADISVLVADDCKSNQTLISVMLQENHATVYCADNGQQALQLAKSHYFDLIILDINMPIMDGTTAMKRLKKRGIKAPIIALTANSMKHQVDEFIKAGFDEHIAKPIVPNQFYNIINRLLDIRGYNKSTT